MRKFWYILKEMGFLIWAHRLYFTAPLLIMLALLVLLAFYAGPAAVLTFIYAGF